ncbi:hypothetical protein NQZ79_g5847 [Umbelopsis isabellina]|nr:hypothetical protein NQZ79_g5847 [Umbelopsis isabellina]
MIPNTLYRLIRTGVVHPYAAYQTYKVYVSRDPMGAEHWNMYWMVIAAYMALELVTDIFLSWLPFYSMAKLLILIWLTALRTQGSTVIFHEIIHPHLAANETEIDEALATIQSHAKTRALSVSKRIYKWLESLLAVAIAQSHILLDMYMKQRLYMGSKNQRMIEPSTGVAKYSRRPIQELQEPFAQSQIKKFEVSEHRRLSTPDHNLSVPSQGLPVRTPSPSSYSREHTNLRGPRYREYTREQQERYNNVRKYNNMYQSGGKASSDVWVERSRNNNGISLVPPRSQSAAPTIY